MRTFLHLMVACTISLVLYLVLFGLLVSRPLVVDQAQAMLEKKLAYGLATGHPKIVLIANSNARFSHSCAVLEQLLHRPCVNLGVSGDVGIDWVLDAARRVLARGDLAYMPLEFDVYSRPRARLFTGLDAAYRFRHDKRSLAERGPEGVARAAFMFSLPTLAQSLGEMALAEAGVRRRFGLDTLDEQGDETGHDDTKAVPYLAVIRSAPENMPDNDRLLANPDGSQAAIAAFLDWCRTRGVTAVGGLPTVFNDRPIPDAPIAKLHAFYGAHGAEFLVLANRSQYPRSAFYDTNYHLRESWQKRHSALLAVELRRLLGMADARSAFTAKRIASPISARIINFDASDRVRNQYIVVLKPEYVGPLGRRPEASGRITATERIKAIADDLARRHGGNIIAIYDGVLGGFAIEIADAAIQGLARDTRVQSISAVVRTELPDSQATASPGVLAPSR